MRRLRGGGPAYRRLRAPVARSRGPGEARAIPRPGRVGGLWGRVAGGIILPGRRELATKFRRQALRDTTAGSTESCRARDPPQSRSRSRRRVEGSAPGEPSPDARRVRRGCESSAGGPVRKRSHDPSPRGVPLEGNAKAPRVGDRAPFGNTAPGCEPAPTAPSRGGPRPPATARDPRGTPRAPEGRRVSRSLIRLALRRPLPGRPGG